MTSDVITSPLPPTLDFDSVMEGMLALSEALHDQNDFDNSLRHLARNLEVEALALSRCYHLDQSSRLIAGFDFAENDPTAAQLRRSFAYDFSFCTDGLIMQGMYISTAKAGKTEPDSIGPELTAWMERRFTKDCVFVCLGGAAHHSDFLELHFKRPICDNEVAGIEFFADRISRLWKLRHPGLIAKKLSERSHPRGSKMVSDLLDITNPAKLTRAEFRICSLISRGLSVRSIAEELSLSLTTVRGHLRTIYQKTETEGFYGLAHCLVHQKTMPAMENDIRHTA